MTESGESLSNSKKYCSVLEKISKIKVDFDAIVDHSTIMHIMRSKVEPATPRIKRILELLSSYSVISIILKAKTWSLVTSCQDKRLMTVTLMK